MFYCPKCEKTYEDASQRFCLNDGRRLIRAFSDDKSAANTNVVFKNILNRKTETEVDIFDTAPRFSRARIQRFADSDFLPPFEAEIFEVNDSPEQRTETIESAFEAIPLPESNGETNFETRAETEIQPVSEIETERAPSNEISTDLKPVAATKIESPAEVAVQPAPETVAEKSAAHIPRQAESSRALFAIVGAAILIFGIWGIWAFFSNRNTETNQIVKNQTEIANAVNRTPTGAPTNAAVETAPRPNAPPNATYFQNGRENLKDEALKNYLGFSLYYPNDWKANQTKSGDANTRGTFLDISKNAPSGTPIEQLIVSYYDSDGTFEADAKNFSEEVIETNRALNKIIPNYIVVSEGEKTINDNRRVYELKFRGTGTTPADEKITLWGKRLFVPAAASGVKNGYMLTMLATSLSNDVKSVEQVGVNGDLPKILQTFQPKPTF